MPVIKQKILLLTAIGLFIHNSKIYCRQIEQFIPSGSYFPFFSNDIPETGRKPVLVASFWLDSYPVTKRDFSDFLKRNDKWQRSKISRIFGDEFYLKSWSTETSPGVGSELDHPVTEVSWFAATAYCQSKGKELPTTDQWEYAAFDAGQNRESVNAQIISWYSEPSRGTTSKVGQNLKNSYGLYDMHGLIWEWTLDYGFETQDRQGTGMFCGSGSLGAQDSSDYATFMRYSFRSSLRGSYTTKNLGFRCARRKN